MNVVLPLYWGIGVFDFSDESLKSKNILYLSTWWPGLKIFVLRDLCFKNTSPYDEIICCWQISHTLFGNETTYLIKQKQWKLLSQYFVKSLAARQQQQV